MRTGTRRIALLCSLVALTLPACGGSDSGSTGPGTDNYLPIISNFWKNIATPTTHTLVLQSADDGKASGTFTGKETLATKESDVTGSFTNSKASFVIKRADGTVTYSGTFYGAGKDSLRLTLGNETLTFAR